MRRVAETGVDGVLIARGAMGNPWLFRQVRDALAGICEEVIYGYPADPAGRERVLWRESANRCHARADGA